MSIITFCFNLFFFLSFFLRGADGVNNKAVDVRILIKSTNDKILITSYGVSYVLEEKTNEKYLLVDNSEYEFKALSNDMIATNTEKLRSPIFIETSNPQSYLVIDGIKFKGRFKLYSENSMLNLIEYVDLERYLWGVLAPEMGPTWPFEALKAQAVAARTYALFHINKNSEYDLTSTTRHQLYTGFEKISPQIISAVNETRGEVLTYKKKIFPTYYHANSGGHTTNPAAVWDIEKIPPLKGVKDPYAKYSRNYNWSIFISFTDIVKFLNRSGYFVSKVKDMRIYSKDKSGRVIRFLISTDKGNIKVEAKLLREFIGNYDMKSTLITKIEKTKNGFRVYGRGWGHGIGLCQDGARKMADLGFDYKKILQFYYPGSKITDLERLYER